MRKFSRFLRVILLPVAVLAIVASSSVSASAATQDGNSQGNNDNTTVTVKGPGTLNTGVHLNSMNF
jgi:hypothetical protein